MRGDVCHDFKTTSFGGVTMAQYWVDLLLWEAILNTNAQLKGIVELGTWEGGMARYLFAQAQARRMWFVTFDVIQPADPPPEFVRADIYRYPEVVEQAAAAMGPVALLCDGGNKPRELQLFPPLMPDGSIFVVHDWLTETQPTDVPDFLVEVYGDYCDDIGSISRVFTMKQA